MVDQTRGLNLDHILSSGLGSGGAAPADKSSPVKKKGTEKASSNVERIPELTSNIDISQELGRAYHVAARYMNGVLQQDGLHVDVAQQGDDYIGEVRDTTSGELKRTYDGVQLLKLYAHNHGRRGIVIDGRV